MDHRDDPNQQNVYQKELDEQLQGKQVIYNDQVMIDGRPFRVPYKMVKEIEFANIQKEEMIDMEHAARLQYRLMLQEPVLRAKVEFVKQRITIVYNPDAAQNNKPKISREGVMQFLAKEGVHVNMQHMQERDFDYFKEMYSYHYNPPTIRERPPYGYTMDEWKKMREEYYAKVEQAKAKGREKFEEWQRTYAAEHPDLFEQEPEKPLTLKEKLFGKKKSQKDKGFWFHGV